MQALKAELVNPFLSAGMDVMAQVLGNVKRGTPWLAQGLVKLKDFAVEFRVDGYIQGIFTYTMTQAVALHIAAKLTGRDLPHIDDIARSALAELGNWVSGRTVSQFKKRVVLSVPRIFEGGSTVTSLHDMLLAVPVLSPYEAYEAIEIYLWFQEKEAA